MRRFTGHSYPILAIAFSPDGRLIATGAKDNSARLWESATGNQVWRIDEQGRSTERAIASVAFSPDGRKVMIGCQDRNARILDAATGKDIQLFPSEDLKITLDDQQRVAGADIVGGHKSAVVGVAFSRSGELIATAEEFSEAHLWDGGSGKMIRSLQGSVFAPPGAPSLAFSALGRQFWTKGLEVWDLVSGTARSLVAPGTSPPPVAFSNDGKLLASVIQDKLLLVDGVTLKRRFEFVPSGGETQSSIMGEGNTDTRGPIEQIIFSPTGKQQLTIARSDMATSGCGTRRPGANCSI